MAENNKNEIIIVSDDETPASDSLHLRQLKESLQRRSVKITRRLSDPGYSSFSTLNSQEVLNNDGPPPMRLLDPSQFRALNKGKKKVPRDNDCFIVEQETMRVIDETKESTSCGTSSKNLGDVFATNPRSSFDQNEVIVISDDDEPTEKRQCYQEEDDIAFLRKLREEIDMTFIGNNDNINTDDIFPPNYFDTEINLKMVIDITNDLGFDTAMQSTSSSSDSSTTSCTDDNEEDNINDEAMKKKQNDDNDSKSK